MVVGRSLVADGQVVDLGEQGQRPLDDPLVKYRPLAVRDPAARNALLNITAGERPTTAVVIAALLA